ncbi:MAG: hypothetical protein GC146_15855 [Limimaricola sp.]|uniref:adenylate kinase n=1 Tax=Limimaricola sp. TaxID=2211665 RepID=UPI001D965865|nr:adenylate kinase [Limimaricola sp.]MBI1418690.1 hypothetical protein [Limimaricola sp.]
MTPCRVHITGASGAGVTTLGRALAQTWAVPAQDTDDYYWQPTDPPFAAKRPVPERLELMERLFLPRPAWVLSGSCLSWGDPLVPFFDAVVLLVLDPATRMARLEAREAARWGAAIAPGGPRHAAHLAFRDWAARYDDPAFTGRSLAVHRRWLATLPCPTLTLDSAAPPAALVAAITAWQQGR